MASFCASMVAFLSELVTLARSTRLTGSVSLQNMVCWQICFGQTLLTSQKTLKHMVLRQTIRAISRCLLDWNPLKPFLTRKSYSRSSGPIRLSLKDTSSTTGKATSRPSSLSSRRLTTNNLRTMAQFLYRLQLADLMCAHSKRTKSSCPFMKTTKIW